MAAAVEEECRETFEAFGTSGLDIAVGFEFAFTLEVLVAWLLKPVLLGGEGAGFCDMVGLSALSLLILLVGAVVLFVSESDVGIDADSMDGLCKGADEGEEEEDAFLRGGDGF
jgi:hypothetical protein